MYGFPLLQYYSLYANKVDIISRKFEVAEVVYSRTTHGGTVLKGNEEYRELLMTHIIFYIFLVACFYIRQSHYSYSCVRIFVNYNI